MDRSKTTTRFHLESPYASPCWPSISSSDQDTILEILLSLLAPIGSHRQNHISKSKGKRDKKRKRDESKDLPAPPPLPEIASQILVGFNSITRQLQTLSHENGTEDGGKISDEPDAEVKSSKIAAIFTTHPTPSESILHSHFPLLASTACISHPARTPIRLVQLPKGCEKRLATAMGLPRVNFIAIMENAKGAGVLIDLVRERVGLLEEMGLTKGEAKYREVEITAVEGPVGIARKQRKTGEKKAAEKKGGDVEKKVKEKGKRTGKHPDQKS